MASHPRRKGEPSSGGAAHVDQSNVNVLLSTRKEVAGFIMTCRLYDTIPTFAKVLCERMPYEHVLLYD